MALPIVNMNTAIEIVRQTYMEKEKRSLFLLGKGGIGKSEAIENLAKRDLQIGYIDIRLLLYTETDIKGIPYPDTEHQFTIWLQNDILPRVDRDGERGILVLDEITSAHKTVRTSIYQLINERRLGQYSLPEGWMIVCLGNGEDDGGDYNGMEGNFANRCSIFRVEPDIESFKKYANSNGVNTMVTAYLSWAPGDLHTFDNNDGTEDGLLFASPRSWKAVSDIMNRLSGDIDNIASLRIKSNIGSMVGEKFTVFARFRSDTVDVEDILSGASKKIPKNIEATHMTIQSLIGQMHKELTKDTANIGGHTLDTMLRCANGIRWVVSLKSLELVMVGVKDFISMGKAAVVRLLLSEEFNKNCPEFNKFGEDHGEIFK